MQEKDKLTSGEKSAIVVKALINAVPYVGGSLSTLIFDWQSEKRIKRMESFYVKFNDFIEENKLTLPDLDIHDKDSLVSLIEELHSKVEIEHREYKRNCLLKFFLNTLSTSTNNNNFDERSFFLDSLSSMTLIECELLSLMARENKLIPVGQLSKPNTSTYALVGAIGRLKAYGYVTAVTTTIRLDGQTESAFNDSVKITPFGRTFIEFCLFDI